MKKVMTWFLAAVFLLGTSAIAPAKLAPGDFIDIGGHWAESEIQTAFNLGLMSGVGTTTQGFKVFKPEDTVSRGQLASVLERTFRLDYGKIRFIKAPLASDYYQDVDDKTWYSGAVVVCAINKILEDGTYLKPAESVSRVELARTIYRSFEAKNISVPMIMIMPDYSDIGSLNNEDRNAVVFVNNTGIMQGYEHCFRPGDPIKRGELARVLNRCADLMALNEDSNGQEYTVPVGQTFILSLNTNPSTGFQWNPGSWDDEIMSLNNRHFESSSNEMLVGQGGKEYFAFTALKPGSTEIKLNYARPWESVQPLQNYSLKIIVTPETIENSSLQLAIKPVKSSTELINVDMSIPQISGFKDEKVEAGINQQFIQDADEVRSTLGSQVLDFKNDCEKNGYPFRPYEVYSGCKNYYENGKILSLYVDYYSYTGGAHGSTERRAYNYNLQTGEKLELKDFFKSGYDYKSVIDKQIKKEIAAQPEYYFDGDMGFNGIDGQSCYIENNCLVIYFSQYEIAPYAAGIPEFRLPLYLFENGLKDGLI